MHGKTPERHWVSEVRRGQIWGLYIPFLILCAMMIHPLFATMFAVYPLQIARIAMRDRLAITGNWAYAFFMTLGKFPEMQGQFKFYLDQIFKKRHKIIEYK